MRYDNFMENMFFDPEHPDENPIDLENLTYVASLKIPPVSTLIILERTDLTAVEFLQRSHY